MEAKHADKCSEMSSVIEHATTPSCSCDVSTAEKNASAKPMKKTKADFMFLDEIGSGSFSTVYNVIERSTGREFAAKVCMKSLIVREKKVQQIYREKEALARLSRPENLHPFVIRIFCTFQDPGSLYIVTTLAKGGELLQKLKKSGTFSLETTKFYSSEIVVALAHLHKLKIIHRDLKPENILLSEKGHILLSDFGSSKILDYVDTAKNQDKLLTRRSSFVGTAQYVSPEVLRGEAVEQACDYWALGVIIFQFLTGEFLFNEVSEYLTYKKIVEAHYALPEEFPSEAGDLIQKFVVVDVKNRLGSTYMGGDLNVKAHNFFSGVNFDELVNLAPPMS
uniref:non-specific serine/threonine protein kinase n=1 Tax=Syphacia muris TaxID=451379 RepID=A0A0N5B0X9_9BILA